MKDQTFEYAIRKDVRNNPIVREIDRERQRELWRAAGLGVFLVLVLLCWGWPHLELLHHGYVLENMRTEQAREIEINRHLRLEIDTLTAPARIESLARGLGMVPPGPDDALVIERVMPPPPPASVVARR